MVDDDYDDDQHAPPEKKTSTSRVNDRHDLCAHPYDRSAPVAPGCRRLNSFFIGKPLHQWARDDVVSTDARPLVGARPINALAAGNLAPHTANIERPAAVRKSR